MTKVRFKNPEGDTPYHASLGFDWAAFFGFIFLGGLPFFLRKMTMLGIYTLLFDISMGISFAFVDSPTGIDSFGAIISAGVFIGIGIYFGIKGGELTARHYKEQGFKIDAKDKTLVALANEKWGFDQ